MGDWKELVVFLAIVVFGMIMLTMVVSWLMYLEYWLSGGCR